MKILVFGASGMVGQGAVRESLLSVSGERRARRPSGVVAFHCMERPVGRFAREVPIDRALDLKDDVSQAVMKPVGVEGYDYTYVIMPMRV